MFFGDLKASSTMAGLCFLRREWGWGTLRGVLLHVSRHCSRDKKRPSCARLRMAGANHTNSAKPVIATRAGLGGPFAGHWGEWPKRLLSGAAEKTDVPLWGIPPG